MASSLAGARLMLLIMAACGQIFVATVRSMTDLGEACHPTLAVQLIDLPSGQPGHPSRAMTQAQAAKVLKTAVVTEPGTSGS